MMLTHGGICVPLLFSSVSVTLCNGLAAVAHHLCIDYVHSAELMAFVACKRIPLDKKSGVRSMEVGDVPLKIIAKLSFIRLAMVSNYQLGLFKHVLVMMLVLKLQFMLQCMRAIFEDNNTHAALLVHATNAFNLVNRQAALHNTSVLCPSFSTILKGMYIWCTH